MTENFPLGWAKTDVGSICNIVGGGTPSTKRTDYWDGVIPWISSADIYGISDIRPRRNISELAIVASTTNRVPRGSIIVVTRVGLGKVAITNEPLCFSQDSQGLVFNRSELHGLFLTHYLSEAVQRFRYESRGTTISGVTKRQLRELPVLLPPIAEQRRIVAEIEKQFTRLDASMAALKRVQANLKRYRASVLKAACEGKLVLTEAGLARSEGRDYEAADLLLERILAERRARWKCQAKRRGKYKEPVAPDTSGLPELPERWVWAGLDQLATVVRNGYSKPPRGDIGTPILRISAVRPLSVDLRDIRWVDSKDDLAGFLIHPGDLLFTRYNGNTELVGVCGVVPALERDTLHPDKLIRACLTKNGAVPNFVQIVANSGVSRKFLARRIRTTAGQSGISGSDLKSMPIPLPPLSEQHRIVAEVERRLSVIQQTDAAVEANLTRVERLRQSILKQAFSGKLVPQDPNDEHASVLLGRIRAEREAADAAAKAQRTPRRRGSKSTRTARPKFSEAAR